MFTIYIVVSETEKIRTKLDVEKDKNIKLEEKLVEKSETIKNYEEIFNNLDKRIKNLEENRDEKFKIDEFF